VFSIVKNLHGTFREEEFDGPESGVFKFCVSKNYDFLVIYVQIMCINILNFG